MKIFILAGGFGTRLKSVISNVPKPMAPIGDKPFLDYQISNLRKYFPLEKVYLLTFHMSEIIEKYYKYDKNIEIIKEPQPLGTGGSIKSAIKTLELDLNTQLLILNGDTYVNPDFDDFIKNNITDIQILGSFQNDCSRYGTLKIKNDKIIAFQEKNFTSKNNYINAGCYLFNNLNFFNHINLEKFALEEALKEYINNYGNISIYKYNDTFIDIGIPNDYKKMIDLMDTKE